MRPPTGHQDPEWGLAMWLLFLVLAVAAIALSSYDVANPIR